MRGSSTNRGQWAAAAFAVAALVGAAPAAADEWQLTLTPYVWAAAIGGSTGTGGIELPDINPDYSLFTLENLDLAGFAGFTARKGSAGILVDALYVSFSDAVALESLTGRYGIEGGVLTLAGTWQPSSWRYADILVGARTATIALDVSLTTIGSAEARETWVDPIIGLRVDVPVGRRWRLTGSADIGGFGVGSDASVNLVAGAMLAVGSRSSLLIGYRYLGFDFTDDDATMDLELSGLLAGWSFGF